MKFVIGDIHGEFYKLKTLVDSILREDAAAEFIFIGDYVDKGEQVKEVLDFLSDFKTKHTCTFLLGNHEYQWIEAAKGDETAIAYLLKYGGRCTMNSFKTEDVQALALQLESQYAFAFSAALTFTETPDYFICHSGLPALKFAALPAQLEAKDLLFNRYDFLRHPHLYCGKRVIFGHTAFYQAFYDGFKVGIDTGACYLEKQPLTAFCVDTEVFYNSNDEHHSLNDCSLEICPNIIREKSKKW
ncbi:MAG: fructose-bisphosphatase class III [Flavobacteriales bacterium]